MAKTPSTMLALGTALPAFSLPDPAGRLWNSTQLLGTKGLLVMFICNHCPYVVHVAAELAKLGHDYLPRGVGIVAINSNDVESYPDDRPELMAVFSQRHGYTFPYLYDATQNVARAFQAACTPDFYLFNSSGSLVYRGQLDPSRPGSNIPVTGADLRAALDALVTAPNHQAGSAISPHQVPSIGCNIKWRR